MTLKHLSDDDLITSLQSICATIRQANVQLIAHLIEVESRSLHLRVACSSLFDFCVRRLRMSESASQRRLVVARLARRMPCLLEHLESGKVHLSAVFALRDHLTEANVEEWLEVASGKSRRELEALLATRAPRPDAPETSRTLPTCAHQPLGGEAPPPLRQRARFTPPERVQPISAQACVLQLTVSVELLDKLERARDLLRHQNPRGDLAPIVEAAVDLLLAKAEAQRLGKAAHPRARRATKPGRIARAVRREVFERDGEQCTFVDPQGRRCPSRAFLELDHVQSRALGGSDEATNLRVLCRAHNRLHAEADFGKEYVAERIHCRQRQCADVARKEISTAPGVTAPAATEPIAEPAPRGTVDVAAAVVTSHAEPRHVASEALVRLGFPERDVRRALAAVEADRATTIEALLREGLATLTAALPVIRSRGGPSAQQASR